MKVFVSDGMDTEEAEEKVHNRHCRFTTTVTRDEGSYGRGRVDEVVERDRWDVGEERVKIHVITSIKVNFQFHLSTPI